MATFWQAPLPFPPPFPQNHEKLFAELKDFFAQKGYRMNLFPIHQKQLETYHLELSNCSFIRVIQTTPSEPRVAKLSLSKLLNNEEASYITWQRLIQLVQKFPKLETLHITCWKYNEKFRNDSYMIRKWADLVPQLRELSLIQCYLNDSALQTIIKSLPELTLLEINLNDELTSQIYKIIPIYLKNLKTLCCKRILAGKGSITDLKQMSKLQTLSIGFLKTFLDQKSKHLQLIQSFDNKMLTSIFSHHQGFKNLTQLNITTNSKDLFQLAKIRTLKKIIITSKARVYLIALLRILVWNKNLVKIEYVNTYFNNMIGFAEVVKKWLRSMDRKGLVIQLDRLKIQ